MSRIDFQAKPWIYPMPVLIIGTYDENGNANAMNAAWGINTDYQEISISMASHKTTDNLAKTGAFTVSLGTQDTYKGCDYVGVETGHKQENKVSKAGFTTVKSEHVNAPVFNELPICFECIVKSFNDGILVGKVVNISVDEKVLKDGKPDLSLIKPISYNPIDNTYIGYGDVIGHAFKDGLQLK